MHRSTARFVALLVLALLGAPVAMHVILHDHAEAHGDHEHPLISAPLPQVPLTPAAAAIAAPPAATVLRSSVACAPRNFVSHGALRTDEDVGLQPLLSTFLI